MAAKGKKNPHEKIFFSGFKKDTHIAKGELHPAISNIGTLQKLVETRFLKIGSRQFSRYIGNGFFRTDEAIVPFYGSFYKADGSEVSDEELAKVGLEWLKDEKGEYVCKSSPVFVPSSSLSELNNGPLPPFFRARTDEHADGYVR